MLLLVALVALYVVARTLLPAVAERRGELEAFLSGKTAHTVRIGDLAAHWENIHPGVRIQGMEVIPPRATRPAIKLDEVRLSVALIPLLWGEIRIDRLVLVHPRLALERTANGALRVPGIEMPEADPVSADATFLAWLLRQQRLEIHDGELTWIDRRESAPLQLTAVDLRLRNYGSTHRLEATAKFPAAVCGACSLSADIDGTPFSDIDWGGDLDLRATGLDVQTLPLVARERLPAGLQGKFDLTASSRFDDGRLDRARGYVRARAFVFPRSKLALPLVLREASGDFDWSVFDDGWRLDFAQLTLALRGAPWVAGQAHLGRDGAEYTFKAQHLNLDDLTSFIADMPSDHPAARWWNALAPRGAVDHLKLRVDAGLDAIKGFSIGADLARVYTRAHEKIPGVQGLSGRLQATHEGGMLTVRSKAFAIDLPRLFRAPLAATQVDAALAWQRASDHWLLEGGKLRVVTEDGQGTGSLRLRIPHDRSLSPALTLRVDFSDGNGAHAARYYPAQVLPPKTLAWMESAFLGGHITSGHLIYDGPIRAWPFNDGQGTFELRAHVRDGVYRYLPRWAPVTHADVDVAIDGSRVHVAGKGRIGALAAQNVVVEVVPPTATARRTVHVTGFVAGAVAEALQVVSAAQPEDAVLKAQLPRITATGNGTLDLAVHVPLGEASAATYNGVYRLNQAGVALPAAGVAVTALSGEVRFSEIGIDAGKLTGTMLGGVATIDAARRNGALEIEARGQAQPQEGLRAQWPAIAARLNGVVPWSLAWRERAGLGEWRVELDATALKARLPAPLDRPDGLLKSKLVIQTEQAKPDTQILGVRGEGLAGRIDFTRTQNRWRLARGFLDLGVTRALAARGNGVHVAAGINRLDLKAWLSLFAGRSGASPPGRQADAATNEPDAPWLARITADVQHFELFDRDFGRVQLDLAPVEHGWRALLDGDAAAGIAEVTQPPGQARRVRLDLAHLRFPEASMPATHTEIDSRALPMLEIVSRAVEYQDRKFGALDAVAVPTNDGWRIERLNVTRPEAKFVATGHWRASGERQATELDIAFDSRDMGQTMAALGAPGQMANGDVEVHAQLAWPGTPFDPGLARLDGRVRIRADKGRFLQVGTGAARLFGLLDLKAIGRYLTFDFSPVFGRGFVFDTIKGTIAIERGNAYTRDLGIKGPSATLAVDGRVGLAAEDYDLVLEVAPQLSDTLTLTSWGLLGPQAAVTVLALQRLFKKQIYKGTRVTYTVEGPWENPTVKKQTIWADSVPFAPPDEKPQDSAGPDAAE